MGDDSWKYDIYAESDGMLAVLPYGEVKTEMRRQPRAMYRVLEIAANYAFETTHFNIVGESKNPVIKFNHQNVLIKKVREFFMKNPIFKTFIHGMDKKDERVFMNEVKAQSMAPGDRVVRRNTKDRAMFIVIQGQFFGLDDSYPSNREIFKTGSIIGADQFMKDDYWDMDLICKEDGSIIGKFDFKAF
jgi:hypothetical protein